MKLSPYLSLILSLVPTLGFAESSNTNLGNVMYIGDSITHGYSEASYRWALHKIFADNGITYNSVGVNSGNTGNGTIVSAGTSYGGSVFNNVHSSQSSARAYEISGNMEDSTNEGSYSTGRFNNSNIDNWLGISDIKNNNQTYTGTVCDGAAGNSGMADTYFLMIGTNDLLSDNANDLSSVKDREITQLINNVVSIHDSILTANANANIVICSIPVWGERANINLQTTRDAVVEYNNKVQNWANQQSNVTYIDINKGIIDVANSMDFYGVNTMFLSSNDRLHPNAQGNLIIAGNIAKSQGYAGRTAGQQRLGNEKLQVNFRENQTGNSAFKDEAHLVNLGFQSQNIVVNQQYIDFGANGLSSLSYNWSADADLRFGYTVDFNLLLGDGALGGWDTANQFSISLGDGSLGGTLNMNEAYIQWGNTILYSMDMSTNTESIRIAYVNGDSSNGLLGGYYVWLGDMLIGEGLSGNSSNLSGVSISYSGSGNAILNDLALDSSGSYAPTSSGLQDLNNNYLADKSLQRPSSNGNIGQGSIVWKTEQFDAAGNVAGSGSTNTSSYVNMRGSLNVQGGADSSVMVTYTGGTDRCIFANYGNYTGDVWASIEGGSCSGWIGGHSNGTLNGDVYLRINDKFTSTGTVFAAVNSEKLSGNAYIELNANNAIYDTFTFSGFKTSVAGAYQSNIDGNVDFVLNGGTYNNAVMGGIHTGSNYMIGGNTSITINAGSYKGVVMGGGITGTIKGNTSLYITGGTFESDIRGGGQGDTINGNTSVTIQGNIPVLQKSDGSWVSIFAGSSTAQAGSSSVTIKDLTSSLYTNGFDKYAGVIDGGQTLGNGASRTLNFNNSQLDLFHATLINFDILNVENNSSIGLLSIDNISEIKIGDMCSLDIQAHIDASHIIMGNGSQLTVGGLNGKNLLIDISHADSYNIVLGENISDLSQIQFKKGDQLYDSMLNYNESMGRYTLTAQIPEPSSVSLGVLGMLSLLLRRRRVSSI